MYIAKHYVKDERGLFGPGEIIPEDLEEDKLERLLKLGAIRKAEPPKVIRQTAPEPAPAAGTYGAGDPRKTQPDPAAPQEGTGGQLYHPARRSLCDPRAETLAEHLSRAGHRYVRQGKYRLYGTDRRAGAAAGPGGAADLNRRGGAADPVGTQRPGRHRRERPA